MSICLSNVIISIVFLMSLNTHFIIQTEIITFVYTMPVMWCRELRIACQSQRLGILRKSCRVFHDRSLLERCFRGFVLHVLECSAVCCSATETHLKLLDRAVSGARFQNSRVYECDIVHCRSVAVLCMLYKIRCNPMRPSSLWCPTCAVCASASYTRCSGRTSVYLCTSSLRNLAVPQYLDSPLRVPVERPC